MLTALDQFGRRVQLIHATKSSPPYYCPLCKQPVIAKRGSYKVWHFAHERHTACEGHLETAHHRAGKQRLYDWLLQQKLPVELEWYLPEIKQRPDLYFKRNAKAYAIEYQCSATSQAVIQSRTANYLKAGIEPIWILGEPRIQSPSASIQHMTSFDWLFVLHDHVLEPVLLTFSPVKQSFTFFQQLIPLSHRKTLVQAMSMPLEQARAYHLSKPPRPNEAFSVSDIWLQYKTKWRLTFSQFAVNRHSLARRWYTAYGKPVSLLPSFIGLPCRGMNLVKGPAWEWQAEWMLAFVKPRAGRSFTLKDVAQWLSSRQNRFMTSRKSAFPTDESRLLITAVQSYLDVLCFLRICHKDKTTYQIQWDGAHDNEMEKVLALDKVFLCKAIEHYKAECAGISRLHPET
ncbi:hypothetical protein G4V62_06255 [Bacillaceae bacterium SIJ1]|uniref:competence protein CoiA n=1 Tax=Litoribacterium kuwaitense TaxID=1398745 RepID=UPI0013ED8BDB|nr:competence protein CoiA family protein [Litoribacterium kuwaitense]NGP44579.1 hypothetical protein [Litoribacterium kuwaitense]